MIQHHGPLLYLRFVVERHLSATLSDLVRKWTWFACLGVEVNPDCVKHSGDYTPDHGEGRHRMGECFILGISWRAQSERAWRFISGVEPSGGVCRTATG